MSETNEKRREGFNVINRLEIRNQKMLDVIFREYDIRGRVGTELDINQVYDLARALAFYFLEHNPDTKNRRRRHGWSYELSSN